MKLGKWYKYMYTNMEVDSLSTINGTYFAKFTHTGGNSATYPLKARVLTEDAFDGKTYDIEIDQGSSGDRFRWSDDGGSTWNYRYSTTYDTIVEDRWVCLAPGLEIKFPTKTGYNGLESFSLINTPVTQESPYYRNPIKTFYEKGIWCVLEHPDLPTTSDKTKFTEDFPIPITSDFTLAVNPDNHVTQSVVSSGNNMGVDIHYMLSTDKDTTASKSNYEERLKMWEDVNLSDTTTDVVETIALDTLGAGGGEFGAGKAPFGAFKVEFVAGSGTEVIAAPTANKFKVGLFLHN